jgi:putative oxidoreductase
MFLPHALADVALLIGRVLLGVLFFAHGWQKLVTNGIDGTAAFFGQMGVPMPTLAAWGAAVVELVGGAALVLGLLTPLAALVLLLDMIGAYVFVHAGKGLFIDQGGFELVGALGAGCLLLIGSGPGRYSVDRRLFRRSGSGDRTRVRV